MMTMLMMIMMMMMKLNDDNVDHLDHHAVIAEAPIIRPTYGPWGILHQLVEIGYHKKCKDRHRHILQIIVHEDLAVQPAQCTSW